MRKAITKLELRVMLRKVGNNNALVNSEAKWNRPRARMNGQTSQCLLVYDIILKLGEEV